MRVLIVEDTVRLATSLCQGFGEERMIAETVSTGTAALARLANRDLDVVVLDLGLPDIDGLALIERLRATGNQVPVLVLTAREGVDVRVRALELGADDYVVKPFAFEELVARVRALSRRAAAPRWAPLACGDVVLTPGDPTVLVAGARVTLSPRERALLELFVRRRGEPLGRKEILREAFGYDFDPGTNVVDVHVGHVRRKLQSKRVTIEPVRGFGYRLLVEGDDVD